MHNLGRYCLTFLMACVANAEALTVEPANWWTGMKEPALELLVREPGIADAEVSLLPYEGVTLVSSERGDSDNYRFVKLEIGERAKPGELTLKFRFGARETEHRYALWPRREGSAARKGFDGGDVIYLINPDRFANGDKTNDTVDEMKEAANPAFKGGRHGGDIQGVIDSLGYFKDMGYTQLWLTPVRENNMPEYSYHGYAMTDFYRVDPRMGSNELYRELSRTAKQQGIGLIMDMVLNHSGSEHWWAKDKPTKDWLNFAGAFSGTSHARQAIQDPHASAYDKKQFSDGWFVPTMPDLNQRNPHLATYLMQNAVWWIEYADLSGIRVDTYSYSDKAFLARWTERIMTEYPFFNIVGEEWTTNPAIASYWQRGKRNGDGYVSSLPSVMDFSLQEAMVKALNENESWNTGWIRVYQSIANDFLYPDPDNLLVFADNHDMSRVFTELGQDAAKTRLALTLILTTRGIPQLYYGTEVLGDNTGSNDHGDIRIDFPGGFAGQAQNALTGIGLTEAQAEMQAYVKQLLHFRRDSKALTEGKLIHFSPEQGVYAYFRVAAEQTVMVLLNKNSEPVTHNLGKYAEVLQGHKNALDPLSGKEQALGDTLLLAPMEAKVLVLR